MAHPKKQNRANRGQKTQDSMARSLDHLARYDEFFNKIAPKLERMVLDGKGATDIYKIGEAQMAARLLTIAMTEKDPEIAMKAIKEAHDRSLGKSKETLQVNTRYEKLSDEELDALLISETEQAKDDAADRH